jgi:hypothetical protein
MEKKKLELERKSQSEHLLQDPIKPTIANRYTHNIL